MEIMWFCNFTLLSHVIHIILIFLSHFWARDPDPDPKSHIFVIFLVIFVSYYFHILWKPRFPACPYGQSLQGWMEVVGIAAVTQHARRPERSADWLLGFSGRRLGSTELPHARRSGEVGGYWLWGPWTLPEIPNQENDGCSVSPRMKSKSY